MRALSAAASLLVGLAYVLLAPTAQADCPHNNKTDHPHCNGGTPPPPANQSFYFEMIGGDEVTLGTSGPLTVLARCDFNSSTTNNTVEIFVVSSEADWFSSPGGGPKPPDEEQLVATSNSTSSLYAFPAIVNAASPSGHYIGSNNFALGTNVLGFNCFVAGQIITAQAPE